MLAHNALDTPAYRDEVDEERHQDQPGDDQQDVGSPHLVLSEKCAAKAEGQHAKRANHPQVSLYFVAGQTPSPDFLKCQSLARDISSHSEPILLPKALARNKQQA